MADIEISYNGENIAELSASGEKCIKTGGMYCPDDIDITYSKPAVPVPSGSVNITENGTYDVSDKAQAVVDVACCGEQFYQSETNATSASSSNYMWYPAHWKAPDGVTTAGNIQFIQCPELISVDMNELTGDSARISCFNCAKLKSVKFPRISINLPNYTIRQQDVNSVIEALVYGSIGYPVPGFDGASWNYGNNRSNCTITLYTTAASLSELDSAFANAQYRNWNTFNCTMIYRNSVTGEVLEA